MTAAKTMTPKELAEDLGTDAKTLRKFLREWFATNELDTPGQGGRYAIPASDAKKIRKAFATRVITPKTKVENDAVSDDEVDEVIADFSDLDEPEDIEFAEEIEEDAEFEDIDEV